MFVAVTHARSQGKHVAVVTQPRLLAPVTERHVSQQTALRAMLSQQFSGDAAVIHIDMSDAVDLTNPAFCYDGMHLTVDGNARRGRGARARARARHSTGTGNDWMNRLPGAWWHVAALLVVLTGVAALAPEPWYRTDREQYQRLGQDVLQQDCSSLHCSRALLAAIIERLPGPSILKWKAFAVIGNTVAAAAVAILSIQLGLPPTAAVKAMWLSGLGFGGLFTLFDPYSVDPLMFALGPVLTTLLLKGRLKTAGVISAVGVLTKEFAAAPLWIGTVAAAMARRWFDALKTGTVAFAVTTLWLVWQVGLAVGLNYSYGGNPSADLVGGGYSGTGSTNSVRASRSARCSLSTARCTP